jgi:hypothetical protein
MIKKIYRYLCCIKSSTYETRFYYQTDIFDSRNNNTNFNKGHSNKGYSNRKPKPYRPPIGSKINSYL